MSDSIYQILDLTMGLSFLFLTIFSHDLRISDDYVTDLNSILLASSLKLDLTIFRPNDFCVNKRDKKTSS